MNKRLSPLVSTYETRDRIEAISDGGTGAASACLERAKERLGAAEEERLRAAEVLVEAESYEVAYTTAYDAHRGAAEALVLLNGYWRARWREYPGGTQRAQSFERKVDAPQFLDGVKGDMLRGAYIDPANARIPGRQAALGPRPVR